MSSVVKQVDKLLRELAVAAPPDKAGPKASGGDPRFLAVLDEMRAMHLRKSADYGNSKADDPLANLRASARFGIDPWLGAVLRLNDKIARIQSFVQNGRLENEPLEDSLKDVAAYAVLALVLYRETQQTAASQNATARAAQLQQQYETAARLSQAPVVSGSDPGYQG